MKVLKWIGIILLLLVVIIVVIGLILPSEQFLTSSTAVKLPAPKVFYSVATFTDRQSWDPWLEMDPESEVIVEQASGYVGSFYTWNGKKIGRGKMEVDSVVFPTEIHNSLYFGNSPEASHVIWKFKEAGEVTEVEWSVKMVGSNPFARLMNRLMKNSMTKSLDKGLANLKTHLEANGVKMSYLSDPEIKEFDGINAMVAEGDGSLEQVSSILATLYGAVMKVVGEQNLQPAGPPFAIYYNYSEETGHTSIIAGLPVTVAGKTEGMVNARKFEGFRALAAIHSGPYTEFGKSYDILMNMLNESEETMTGTAWEFYLTDPQAVIDESQWKTEIALEIK